MMTSSLSIPNAIHHLLFLPSSSSSPSPSPFPHSFLPPSSSSFPASTISISNPHAPPSLAISRASSSSSSSSSSPRNSKNKTATAKKKTKKKGAESAPAGAHEVWKDLTLTDVEIVQPSHPVDFQDEDDAFDYLDGRDAASTSNSAYHPQPPTPMPKPPAGFIVSDSGKVTMTSGNRIATIVDAATNRPLECVIRRVFRSSKGDECMLLFPADSPVFVLKNTNVDAWTAATDDEIEALLPDVAYALAKINMHLVHSGFCYTARGAFCFSEDDIFDFNTDEEGVAAGIPTDGVEVTYFHLDGAHFMIYTPLEPILFVAVKDQNGMLQIADDDLLNDPAIVSIIDEETEFNALVEEEAALFNSLMGKG